MAAPLVVTGRRVARPEGVGPASVHIADGRIVEVVDVVESGDVVVDSGDGRVVVIDAGDHLVLPGLVDSHVHVNEPGRTEWEGFVSATRAAAAGGTTTIVDMPLNSIPPTVTVAALAAKRDAAEGRCTVDVGFWGGLVPGHVEDLEPLAAAGVCGFKAFLVDSGVEEFPCADPAVVAAALPELSRLGRPLLVHAELEGPMAEASRVFAAATPERRRSYGSFLHSRPEAAEDQAVRLVTELAGACGGAVHVVHLASGSAVPIVAAARSAGIPVTAETCPHYLTLTAEEVPEGATAFKCCPPIRSASHREALWQGLADGHIDMVVSDHSPAPAEMKDVDGGDFGRAWGGIASLQLRLPLTWREACLRGFGLADVVEWLAAAPARLAGLDDRKGRISAGFDADLVVFEPDAEWIVDPARLEHRHRVSPYGGRPVRGRVVTTLLRGEVVYHDGEIIGPPRGALLERAA